MIEIQNRVRETIPEEVMLARLEQSEQMREFFIEMWKQNPVLAKQGGERIRRLLSPMETLPPTVNVPAGASLLERQTDRQQTGSCISDESISTNQSGISLIELIMFIVIISVALTGILLVMNQVTRHSADPLIHKQALAIAESLLEEVELMPFTYCDPDDPSAVVATSPAGCTGSAGGPNDQDVPGPSPATSVGGGPEVRYATPQFDNVSDYGGPAWGATGFTMNAVNGGIKDITNTAIATLTGYSANIVVRQEALIAIPASESLRITVTVTGPDDEQIALDGYRTRYAPRSVP